MKRMWSKNEVKGLSKEVIESGQVDNAKPIYCHPITIVRTTGGNAKFIINLLILDNKSTAYTKTTIVEKLKSIANASWLTTGSYLDDSIEGMYFSPSAIRYANEKLVLYGIDNLGNVHSASQNTLDIEQMLSLSNVVFEDSINKIN